MAVPGTVVTIGTFDGVHRGHQALIDAAREHDQPIVGLAFDPHPLTILRPDAAPARLTQFGDRAALLRDYGVDRVIQLRPTPALLQQEPEQFLDHVVEQYRPVAIVEGPDFRFGRARRGDLDTLRNHGRDNNYDVIAIEPAHVTLDDGSRVRVSSSAIRAALERGGVHTAAQLLGRPYTLRGIVTQGDQRGRDLGFPTANLGQIDQLLPADGIYSGCAERDGRHYTAAISIGTKPTFGEHDRTCEVYLLDYDGPPPEANDYGWSITLRLTQRLRDQVAYDTIDELIDQLHRDVAQAREHCITTEPEVVPS